VREVPGSVSVVEGYELEAIGAGFVAQSMFNTGKAHSLGVEATISAQLTKNLTFTTAIMENEAEIDEDTPR